MQWFEVDKQGLAKLLERRGKPFMLYELVQNCWDQNVTRVDILLTKASGSRDAYLSVTDDDPEGFKNLSHAFTLFAESDKKSNPQQRGRFNLGEKLVLAMCDEAEIVTTTGGVRFDERGRHSLRRKRERGSSFEAVLKMTNVEMAEMQMAVSRLLVPPGIDTFFNGEKLESRETSIVGSFETSLATLVADAEGYLRNSVRKTKVVIYKVLPGEVGTLYEMGIPVVETSDGYHYDVQQKVPVNLDRDNVPPSYLRTLRTQVVNIVHKNLDQESANSAWVKDALSDPNIVNEAVESIITQRFGDKRVIFDPSDPEANALAVTKGYTVVHGGTMSRPEWDNIRSAGSMLPAGQVTPSPKPFNPDGKPLKVKESYDWSETERKWVAAIQRITNALIGGHLTVILANDPGWGFSAAYGDRTLTWNYFRWGKQSFESISDRTLELLIHELGHHYESNHLSENYQDALCRLGARLAIVAASDPSILKL